MRHNGLVAEPLPTRCARTTIGGVSTYTVLGFIGYGVASFAAALMMWACQLPLADRLIATITPPVAFLAVVKITRWVVGYERIVFYQTALAGVIAVALLSTAVGAHTARLVDIATMGVGIFLVFGRIGCFAVACCHGRPSRFGVVYGPEHARLGFWSRWVGRRLWPVQLVESVVSGALVTIGLVVGWDQPGMPALTYIVGYGLARFALELRRGDAARPHALGTSEAQWTSTVTLMACAIWQPNAVTIASAATLVLAIALLAKGSKRRALTQAPHLHEIDRACRALLAARSEERRETSLGVCVSCHPLPDGRLDWVLSASHPGWSMTVARRLAADLWPGSELVEGRLAGVAHVIET
jgi:hypothetical protein